MADDHAAHAIGTYGGRLAALNPTPDIDRLASKGILVKNVFCNNVICTPRRASIITGQHPQTNGVLDLDSSLETGKQYLPIELKRLGYQTAIVGKWYLFNEPANFDYYNVLPGQGKYFNPVFNEKGKGNWPKNTVKSEGHSTDAITNSEIEYLKNGDANKPFFELHHIKVPHGMFESAPRYADYLKNSEIPELVSMYDQLFCGKHYLPESEFGKHYWAKTYFGIEKENLHTWDFYDLKNDPEERHNRYNDPAYKDVIANLKAELRKQREELHRADVKHPVIQKIIEKSLERIKI